MFQLLMKRKEKLEEEVEAPQFLSKSTTKNTRSKTTTNKTPTPLPTTIIPFPTQNVTKEQLLKYFYNEQSLNST